jgi:hypothetical protein
MSIRRMIISAAVASVLPVLAFAEVKPVVEHNTNEQATPAFKFKNVPAPAKEDAATKAKITVVAGEQDPNGGTTAKLNDGKTPTEEDQPEENFFFNAGTEGGRLAIDLGSVINVKEVNTYSWHPNTRGPQVYKLYASEGTAKDFDAAPKAGTDPAKAGWKLIATVDTRPKGGGGGEPGGQYGVSVADSAGPLGKFRYVLIDSSRTEAEDDFGNTFFSEIDVIEQK